VVGSLKRSRGGRKAIDHKALQEAVDYALEELDPDLLEIEKRHFVVKVYIRYFSQTGHRMHTDVYPINRIRGCISKKKLLENGWKTVNRMAPEYDPSKRTTKKRQTTFMQRVKL